MQTRQNAPPPATSNPYPENDPATRYAWDIVNRHIPAGYFAIRACQRHLDDIESGPRRGLYWRPDLAAHALRFFPAVLRVTAGAMEGKPFYLPSYTAFVVGSLYGWVRGDGRLRFRVAWVETGKGQIKALAIDTPIATPAGWTTMGALKAGDQVFDETGRPCNVIEAHEIRADGECYAVRFDDGSQIVADGGHLWRTEMRWSGATNSGAAMRGVKLADRGAWRKGLRTTAEIAATLTYRNGKYQSANHSIPLAGEPHWVTFFAPPESPVFKLRRKAERQAPRHSRRRLSADRRIVSCERVASVPVRCITVDSPSQMFLAGQALVPTHNSPLAAAVGIYTMGYRDIARAECYAIAKDRNQANVLFSDAVAMANAPVADRDDGASLVSLGELIARGTGDMTWMLEHPSTGSKFRALAGDEKVSGPRPSFVAADEIHEWRSDGPLKTWRSAGAKMPGDFLLFMGTNTPAADQIVGTEWSASFQRILRGEVDDDAAFAFIARVDETDDPLTDESCWIKAMPCLGLTFPIENVRIEVNSSRHSVGTMLNTKRLYFGIPVGTSEYWIDLESWEAAQGRVDENEMRGKPCWLGMDLAQKNDLTALSATWRDDQAGAGEPKYYQTHRYWKPADGLADKAREDNVPYVEWVSQKPPLLLTTPGKTIDYDFVAVEAQKFCAVHNVQAMAFDPAYIGEFRHSCDRIGFDTWIWEPDKPAGRGLKMLVHSQGKAGMHSTKALWMPRSLGQYEDLILTKQIVIDESAVTKMCAGNCAVKPDEFGNRYLIKKNSRGHIDGTVSGAMSVGAALFETETATYRGIYSDSNAYAAVFGADDAIPAVPAAPRGAVDNGEWSSEILADMTHPLFAEHKARFERWQDAEAAGEGSDW